MLHIPILTQSGVLTNHFLIWQQSLETKMTENGANNESSSSAKMMTVKKKKGKKRRRVSKHIIANNNNSKSAANNDDTNVVAVVPSRKKPKTSKQVKDPKEAISYLEQWKKAREDWKFNKNTQSWLIRHMYDASVIGKHDYEVLLEYLQDSHTDVQKRLCQDATQRALRYQQHVAGNTNNGDNNEDETYQKMDEHNKRKEYKRARKLLDVISPEKLK
jgi:WKF domain